MVMDKSFDLIVYGGAFNPPHRGHAQVICQLAERHARVLVVPAYRHGHGKVMAPFEHRRLWLERMISTMDLANVQLDACEADLAQGHDRPVYTWDLLMYLAQREGLETDRIAFVIGEDNLATLPRFYRANDLQAAFGVLVMDETINIHSTQIRQSLAQGTALERPWLAPGLLEHDFEYYR